MNGSYFLGIGVVVIVVATFVLPAERLPQGVNIALRLLFGALLLVSGGVLLGRAFC